MKKLLILSALIALLGLTLIGCQQSPESGSGDLALNIADTPVNNVDKVLVTIDKVQVKREEAEWETINDFEDEKDGEKEFDLMTLRFNKKLLGEETLLAGTYNQIRLIVAAYEEGSNPSETGKSKVVYNNGDEDNIFIPSGQQTGLKINHNFQIQEDTITELTLDVDVSEMLHTAGTKIILRSTAIDTVDEVISGNIEGSILDENNDPITDQDVVIEAYETGADMSTEEPVKKTVALAEDEGEAEDDKKAGDFFLRGLEEGTYDLKAYVSDGEGGVDNTYQPETVTEIKVTAEETTTIDDITLQSN